MDKTKTLNNNLTYISLFSCAGVGCYGFKQEGFSCIASVELVERRLNIQKNNNKCKYDSGYICGDIKLEETKNRIFKEVNLWKKSEKIASVDVVIATPPCQGISVINHKKNDKEIERNSLVVESVHLVKEIQPKIFVFENVQAFQKTLCVSRDEKVMPIGEHIFEELGSTYVISGHIMNFMNYGSNSSRTRTLVIGVNKKYRDSIVPNDLFPRFQKEKTLRDVIFDLPRLEWGEIDKNDFYHAFRTYAPEMRAWIHDLKEGESAFDNADPEKQPHKLIDGEIVVNSKKNRDKYTRQKWDRFVQCVHTRNDQLASQNTIHPEQDRVFSIRELMRMMSIPKDFKWVPQSLEELNSLEDNEKVKIYKSNEVNIRQCIGEAVPTIVMRQIAYNIKERLNTPLTPSVEINKAIDQYDLLKREHLLKFLNNNPEGYEVSTLMRISELCNAKRNENAAFYSNKFIANNVIDRLPDLSKATVRVLEPSVGAGVFVPLIITKYQHVPRLIIDVVDIDEDSLDNLKAILKKIDIPSNTTINIIHSDFLLYDSPHRYDVAVGNPPYSKLKERTLELSMRLLKNYNTTTNDLAEMFLERCIEMSDCVALVLNKNILSSEEYFETHDFLRKMKVDSIIDFGRYGFTGVSIETICLVIYPTQKPSETTVISHKYNKIFHQKQFYIADPKLPYFIIYRNPEFDIVSKKIKLGCFDVFRDRQITKSNTCHTPNKTSIWVLKARNINEDGSGLSHIDGYDTYIDIDIASQLTTFKYVNNSSVYLTPNMTYNTRMIENPKDVIVDGSIAVLTPKNGERLSKEQIEYFSSKEFRDFYAIARNHSTQSINVDKCSVYFFGILNYDN